MIGVGAHEGGEDRGAADDDYVIALQPRLRALRPDGGRDQANRGEHDVRYGKVWPIGRTRQHAAW